MVVPLGLTGDDHTLKIGCHRCGQQCLAVTGVVNSAWPLQFCTQACGVARVVMLSWCKLWCSNQIFKDVVMQENILNCSHPKLAGLLFIYLLNEDLWLLFAT